MSNLPRGCLVLRPPRDKNDKGKFQQSAEAWRMDREEGLPRDNWRHVCGLLQLSGAQRGLLQLRSLSGRVCREFLLKCGTCRPKLPRRPSKSLVRSQLAPSSMCRSSKKTAFCGFHMFSCSFVQSARPFKVNGELKELMAACTAGAGHWSG